MDPVEARIAESVEALRRHGALFAYLHGSRASGTARDDSDVDIAAYFGGHPPPRRSRSYCPQASTQPIVTSTVTANPRCYWTAYPWRAPLMVLNRAPLELAGRVALHGKLLFEHDPGARVVWEATTRKIYLDELPRLNRAHREFADAVLRRGG